MAFNPVGAVLDDGSISAWSGKFNPVGAVLEDDEPDREGSWGSVAGHVFGQTPNAFMRQAGRAAQTIGEAPTDFRTALDELAEQPEPQEADPWAPGLTKEQRLELIHEKRRNENELGKQRFTTATSLVTSAALSCGLPGAALRTLFPEPMTAADKQLAATGKAIGDEAALQVDESLEKLNLKEDSFKWYVTNGGQAFINMLPSIATAFVNPALGLSLMGGQAYADVYGESVKKGLDPSNARAKAAFDTVAELIFENKVFDIALKPGAKIIE